MISVSFLSSVIGSDCLYSFDVRIRKSSTKRSSDSVFCLLLLVLISASTIFPNLIFRNTYNENNVFFYDIFVYILSMLELGNQALNGQVIQFFVLTFFILGLIRLFHCF